MFVRMSQQPQFGGFGGFGGQQPQQAQFGAAQQVQFGQAQQAQFGAAQPQQAVFGAAQPQQAMFGAAQPQQAQFGGAQPQQAMFGAAQSQQAQFGMAGMAGAQQATPQQAQFGQMGGLGQAGVAQQAQFGMAGAQQAQFGQMGGMGMGQPGMAQQAQFGMMGTPQQAQFGQMGQTPQFGQMGQMGAMPGMMGQMGQMGAMPGMMGAMPGMGQMAGTPGVGQSPAAAAAPLGAAAVTPTNLLKLVPGPRQKKNKLLLQRPPAPPLQINLNAMRSAAGLDIEAAVQFDPVIAQQTNAIFVQIPNPPPLEQPVGNVKKLATILNAEYDVLQLNGLKLLTNLAVNPNNQVALGQSPLLLILVKILFNFDAKEEVQQQACWALANLSQNDSNKVMIRNAGAFPAIVYHLVGGNATMQEHILFALTNLLREANNKVVFRNSRGLEALADVLEYGKSDKAKDIALKAVMLQGMAKEDKIMLAQTDSIGCIVPYLDSAQEQQKQIAAVIMTQLAADGTLNDVIRMSHGLQPLVRLLQSGNLVLIEQAIGAVVNLATNEFNAEAFREYGIIQPIINLLNIPSDSVKLKTVWAISNLMMNDDNQIQFAELGGIPPLVKQLQAADPQIRMRAAWAITNLTQHSEFLRSDIGRAGGVQFLLQLLMGNDLACAEQALKALVNLSLQHENEQTLLKVNAPQGLVQLLASPVPQIQNLAAMCLVNLSTNDLIRIKFREFGGINMLAQLASLPNLSDPIKIQLSKLITNMSINGRNRFLIKQMPSIIQFLQKTSFDTNLAIKTQADMALRNLSFPIDKMDETEPTMAQPQVSADMQSLIQAALQKAETAQAQQDKRLSVVVSATPTGVVQEKKVAAPSANEIMAAEMKAKGEGEESLESVLESLSLANKTPEPETKSVTPKTETKTLTEEEKKKEEDRQTRRKNIAVELLVTERTYVEGLSMLVKKYMNPMQAASQAKKPVITPEQVKVIFSIAETLSSYHTMLLEGLERRITQWSNETCIGEYIVSMVDFLRCYPQYVNNYDEAIEILTKLEEKPQFAEFLKKLTNSELKGMKIYSYLIMPVQRIPRYIMMLDDLAKRTPTDHPDHAPLRNTVTKISEIMTWVDEQKEVYNSQLYLTKLQEDFLALPKGFTIVEPGRSLIKEGDLEMSGQAYHVFLFSDLLLIAKQNLEDRRKSLKKKDVITNSVKYNFVNKVEIRQATLNDFASNPSAANNFGIAQSGYSFQFTCKSPAEKKEWVDSITKQINTKPTAGPGAAATESKQATQRQVNW